MQSLHSPCTSARRVFEASRRPAVVRARSAATAVAPPVAASDTTSSYAIVQVAGVSQFVEVGRALALRASHVQEASLGKLVRFKEVVAFRGKAGLQRAKSGYLQKVVVEGVVEDEFLGPNPAGPAPLPLRKVLITRIQEEHEQATTSSSSSPQEESPVTATSAVTLL